jgi:hypothetical protein
MGTPSFTFAASPGGLLALVAAAVLALVPPLRADTSTQSLLRADTSTQSLSAVLA